MNDLLDLDLNDFCGKTDLELALMSKENKSAVAVLVSRYSKLIFIKSEIYANTKTDRDDLNQEGLMGLFSAISLFDPGKGTEFSTFAEVCVENRMKSLLVKGNRAASPVEDIEKLSEIHGKSVEETPESIYLCKEYFSELFSGIRSVLTSFEYKVFYLYVQGMSYGDIAEKLSITEKSVDNAMYRARKKIRAMIQKQMPF